ncbi:O-antigen ligase family protein [Pseudonocardia sp. ICBG162]|uniref:O-antigen ligase family protein n=1 Tax=Pseudonocardia sp. ICBG162 TaxID=2846761 RepID=UPI001CF69E0A|nr:O-antigen ligase family protein [Pseudonocardia sp. ICBG162]
MSTAGPGGRLAGLVLAYVVLWTLGLAAGFWVLAAVVLLPALLRSRLTAVSGALLVVAAALVLSAAIGSAAGYASVDRFVGLAANVAVWLALAAMTGVVAASGPDELRRLVRAVLTVGTVHSVVAVVAVWLYPTLLPVPLLARYAGSLPPGVAAFTTDELVVHGWLDGSVLRAVGMMGNTTWSGAVSALTVLVLLSPAARSWAPAPWRLLAGVACVAAVYLSYSRATQIALAVALLVVLLRRLWRARRTGPAVVVAACGLLAAGLAGFAPGVVEAVTTVNAARAGSAESRGAIYTATLDRLAELGLPVLGYGLKPRGEGLVASIATHSTYLGLTFRAGLVGLLALLVCGVALWRTCAARSALPRAIVATVAVWSVFEDLDAGHLVPVFVVVALALARLDRDPAPADEEEPHDRHDVPLRHVPVARPRPWLALAGPAPGPAPVGPGERPDPAADGARAGRPPGGGPAAAAGPGAPPTAGGGVP